MGMAKRDAKTCIAEGHLAAEGECASDFAVEAAGNSFPSGGCGAEGVDYALFCTKSPAYLPSRSAGALDFGFCWI